MSTDCVILVMFNYFVRPDFSYQDSAVAQWNIKIVHQFISYGENIAPAEWGNKKQSK